MAVENPIMRAHRVPSLKRRRQIAIVSTALVIAIFVILNRRESDRLGMPAYFSGFSLLSGISMLMLLGIRKRISFWPLGSVSMWTQIHLYVGIFTTSIYLIHVPSLIADGLFESFLSLSFLSVTASGFYGLYASRMLPKKLTSVGSEHRFDRMDWGREQIAMAATTIYGQIEQSSAKEVLDSFYQRALSPFFVSRPSLVYVIAPNGLRRKRLLGDLKELDRYLEDDGRRAAGQLAALVRRRDDLDYQYALQLRLRCWVVFHSLLSLVLFVAALVHLALVLRFTA